METYLGYFRIRKGVATIVITEQIWFPNVRFKIVIFLIVYIFFMMSECILIGTNKELELLNILLYQVLIYHIIRNL